MEAGAALSTELAPGAVVAGRYRLERVLGRGAMGAVFEASEPGGKRVAIKTFFRVFSPTDTGGDRARFQREAAVNQNLASEHIVRVHDHGFDPVTGTPFIVMDLLEGEDLEATIARVGALDARVAATIMIQVCKGLEVAHSAGVIHRDVKPSNIFLQNTDGGITVKLCDFGIAKVLDQGDSLTATGSVLGSPLFMAPEQFVSSKRVDERSDVWSVAMTLYHALAGRSAFHAIQTFAQLVVAVSEGKIPPLQDAAPWVSADLAVVVHGGLLVDRSARCPSIREFAAALEVAAPPYAELTRDRIKPLSEEHRARASEQKPLLAHWKTIASSPPGSLEPADPLLGEVIAGQYRLVRVLGRGGMGAVYEAESVSGGAACALKVIRPDLAEHKGKEAIRRFVREAKASQSIESPYVARIIDAGADDARGLPYLAMELLHGRDLGALIKELGPLEPDGVLPAFVQACEGLAAAHARGIVHRDIKPANIFLHETPQGEVVAKVCDFGVAKQVVQLEDNTELTRTGSVLGSPMYMSPEQAQNAKNVDHQSDIWSLGISLYESLTGQKAWEGSTMGELILAICTRQLQPVQEIAPWVKPELADVIHRATERELSRRFDSAEAFAAALRALVPTDVMSRGSIRGVSPERRRTAISARSSSNRSSGGLTPVTDATALAQASVISVAQPVKRSRTTMVAAVAIALGLAATSVGLMMPRNSSTGTSAQAAFTMPATPAVPASSTIATAASSAPTPADSAAADAGPAATAHVEPKTTIAVRKASATVASSVAASPPKPAASVPTFKTTW